MYAAHEVTNEMLSDLEIAAREAGGGDWRFVQDLVDDAWCVVMGEYQGAPEFWVARAIEGLPWDMDGEATSRFIATANPSVVLALAAEIRRLREDVAYYERWAEQESAREEALREETEGMPR